ncbi:unnamed protein product [marine sediment metagenome]|uniref:Uncharacterized protein n=1 Tax=marine sediment metagenome TaxID=412755 RepID=X1LSW6_9ZZZZ
MKRECKIVIESTPEGLKRFECSAWNPSGILSKIELEILIESFYISLSLE